MAIEPGTLLADRYRVVRVIGNGGMGVVVEARNVVTDKRVAVKWLHAHIASDPEASQRLIREATAACRIRHPNVVDVYDVIRDNSSILLVMELLEGEPLRAALDRRELGIPAVIATLLPAMEGVAEAHRMGVIHRDIHPANIFLCRRPSGQPPLPKVLDFGISKLGGEDSDLHSLTRSGMTMGTPLYMSYEQLLSARDVDVRTDVYAFGVVLYEALTGQVPYDGENFGAIAMQIVNGTPVPPRELRPEIPAGLERIVLRAMARNREDRIASLADLARELAPFAVEPARDLKLTDVEFGPPAMAALSGRPPAPSSSSPEHSPPDTLPPTPLSIDAAIKSARTGHRVDTQGHTSSPVAESATRPALGQPQRSRRKAMLLGMLAGGSVMLVVALLLHSDKPSADKPKPPAALPVVGAVQGSMSRTRPALAPTQAAIAVPPKGVQTSTLGHSRSDAGTAQVAQTNATATLPGGQALDELPTGKALPQAARPVVQRVASAVARTPVTARVPTKQQSSTPHKGHAPEPMEPAQRFRAGRARREDF